MIKGLFITGTNTDVGKTYVTAVSYTHLASYFLIKEIPLTFYHDKENYYAEIYLPII